MYRKSWTVVILTMLACTINPQLQVYPEGEATQTAEVLPKATSPLVEEEYRLGYGDEIEVKFFNNSEYNETVQVRPDGRITLQRVGDIRVVGMPIGRLSEIIRRAYAEILVDPEVTVFLRSAAGRRVYVMGEVQQPGSYELVRGLSALRAVAAAGGPTHRAKMSSVMLLRRGDDNQLQAQRLDLTLGKRGAPADDVPLQAFDLIYVPKTFIADVDAWISQIYRIVLTPLDVYSRSLYYQRALTK